MGCIIWLYVQEYIEPTERSASAHYHLKSCKFVNSAHPTENQSHRFVAGNIILYTVASLCFKEIHERLLLLKRGGEEAVKTNAAWVWLSSKNQGGSVMFKWKLLQTPAHHDWSPVWWCSANSLIPHLLSSHFRLCAGVREGGDGREEWLAGRLGNTENKGSWKGRGILPAKAAWLPGMVRSGAALHLLSAALISWRQLVWWTGPQAWAGLLFKLL